MICTTTQSLLLPQYTQKHQLYHRYVCYLCNIRHVNHYCILNGIFGSKSYGWITGINLKPWVARVPLRNGQWRNETTASQYRPANYWRPDGIDQLSSTHLQALPSWVTATCWSPWPFVYHRQAWIQPTTASSYTRRAKWSRVNSSLTHTTHDNQTTIWT